MRILFLVFLACAYPRAALRTDHVESDVLAKLPLDMDPTVTWMTCHEPSGNGYYLPGGRIVLCNENAKISPLYARYVLLHELGHAAIEHYGIRVVGSEEAAADEFAALMDVLEFNGEDILWTADFFDRLGRHWIVPDDDEHPSFPARAEALRCVERGHREAKSGCAYLWNHAVTTWHKALVGAGYDKDIP